MSMFKCGKCKDTGEIVLFSSRVPCECSPVAPELRTVHSMGLHLRRGEALGRGRLYILFTKGNLYTEGKGVPTAPAEIYYKISHVSQGIQTQVPGDRRRVPVTPEVGEYYAPHLVSPTAEPGDYQIEWSYRESTSSPEYTLTGKFTVEDVP